MHRRPLLEMLASYRQRYTEESQTVSRMETFIENNPDCFHRSLLEGHITASAWLLNQSQDCVLLTHHAKLGAWMQLGGHADGCSDVREVALKEAREESGIEQINLLSSELFDIDIHEIPEKGGLPKHLHYDVRMLCQTFSTDNFKASKESLKLAWVRVEDVAEHGVDESVMRMSRKFLNLRDRPTPKEILGFQSS